MDQLKLYLIGSTLITMSIIAIYKYNKRQQSKRKPYEKQIDILDKIRNRISRRLENDTNELKEKAIKFYIRQIISNYNFSYEEEQKIFGKYPKEYTTPSLPSYEDLFGKEIKVFEDILREKVKNYPKKDQYILIDAYQNMILEEAKKIAGKILDKYKQEFTVIK